MWYNLFMRKRKLIPSDKIKTRRIAWAPNHPLATKNGYVSKARMVLYDAVGPGKHKCHWCGIEIEWVVLKNHGTTPNGIVADHVDNNWRNNDPQNLVVSCVGCNGVRSRAVRDDEVFIVRKNGTRLRAVARTCEYCGDEFLAQPLEVKRGKGRFCSMSCARKKPRGII